MDFMSAIKAESAKDQIVRTENGAAAYKTTGSKLLDLNFGASSFRKSSDQEIIDAFMDAYSEDPVYAIAWLFYCRDCRGGMGERRFFRVVMNYLASQQAYADVVIPVLSWVPEYGRWDDMIQLLRVCCDSVADKVYEILKHQLDMDVKASKRGEMVSLLAKWMPSDNATSVSNRALAMKIASRLGVSIARYRKTMVALRSYIDLLERKLSENRWSEVDYEHVPSQANLLYRNAFLKHDRERRTAYLASVQSGEAKIHASTLFPHDVVSRYGKCPSTIDPALEALWNNLPDYVDGESKTLVVRDGSYSMTCRVGDGSNAMAMDVSTALAIYFAERCKGPFQNQFITFSSMPKVVSIAGLGTLAEKLHRCYRETECTNTNIEAVFNLILRTAISSKCSQEDLPSTVLIVSDMEFDRATTYGRDNMTPLFEEIRRRFLECGYQMPKLAFWNVCSRSKGIPLRENENGVALVSGFAPATIKMVLQEEADPHKALMNVLNSERYAAILDALKRP